MKSSFASPEEEPIHNEDYAARAEVRASIQAVLFGGRSPGRWCHRQPVRGMEEVASGTSRMAVVRGRPPGSGEQGRDDGPLLVGQVAGLVARVHTQL